MNGKNVKENEFIKLGQYHTLEIELNRPFTVTKEHWDVIYHELLEDISDPMKKADIAALVMQEGLANLCLIKSAMTKTCAKIERNLPKKKQVSILFLVYNTIVSQFAFCRGIKPLKKRWKSFIKTCITPLADTLTSI